jgi:hypothetical protein
LSVVWIPALSIASKEVILHSHKLGAQSKHSVDGWITGCDYPVMIDTPKYSSIIWSDLHSVDHCRAIRSVRDDWTSSWIWTRMDKISFKWIC